MFRVSFCLIVLACQVTTAFANDVDYRRWIDNTGNFSTRAQLVAHDRVSGQVTLERKDGRTVVLPYRRLSRSDQEFLQKAEDLSAAARPVRIAGIEWHEDLRDAQRVARGAPPAADDRPILCFRVLGDMEGFM